MPKIPANQIVGMKNYIKKMGDTGLEPVTPSVSYSLGRVIKEHENI